MRVVISGGIALKLTMNRNCQEILSKMLLSDMTISSSDIRDSINISRKTLVAEIQKLSEHLRNYGAYIKTVKGIGYTIEKLEPERFDRYKEEFLRHYYRDRYMYYDINYLTYFIIMEYLVSDDYIKIEKLAEKYFYSKSTISQSLKRAKKYLERFNLELESRPRYGLIISGGEWNKRICIVFTAKIAHGINFMQEGTIPVVNTFRKILLKDQDNLTVIKGYMEPYLQKFRIYIPYVYLTLICNYILLAQNRLNYYGDLKIAREHIESVKGTVYYTAAKDIAGFLESKDYIIKENDIVALAILMDSYSNRDGNSKINKELYELCADDANSFINHASMYYKGVEQCLDGEFINDFIYYLVGLRRRLMYRLPCDEEVIFSAKHEGSFMADLCIDFARHFYDKHGIWLETAELMQAYYIFASAFTRNYRYRAQYRAVLVSLYGVSFAKDVSARLMRIYDRHMIEIVPMELTEVNHTNLSKYDLIITDIAKKHIVKSKLPVLFFDVYRENYLHSLDNFLVVGMAGKLRQIVNDNNIIRNTDFQNKEHVFRFIAERFVNEDKREEFLKDCRKNNELLTCERKNAIAVITTYPKYYNRRDVIIIINSTSFYWDNEQVQMIIFFNRRERMYHDILTVNMLQRRLLGDVAGIVQKIASMTAEEIISYMANL